MIAGAAKGRRLVAPRGLTTRPAPDRLRVSIFGTLGDQVAEAEVLDLFAGSGTLGIEAFSRGARSCVFVERDPAAVRAIERNLETTGFGERALVVRGDVDAFLRGATQTFDLVFCDPPYADVELLALLLAGPDLRRVTQGRLVVRTLRKHAPAIPTQWLIDRERVVGEDLVRYLR